MDMEYSVIIMDSIFVMQITLHRMVEKPSIRTFVGRKLFFASLTLIVTTLNAMPSEKYFDKNTTAFSSLIQF